MGDPTKRKRRTRVQLLHEWIEKGEQYGVKGKYPPKWWWEREKRFRPFLLDYLRNNPVVIESVKPKLAWYLRRLIPRLLTVDEQRNGVQWRSTKYLRRTKDIFSDEESQGEAVPGKPHISLDMLLAAVILGDSVKKELLARLRRPWVDTFLFWAILQANIEENAVKRAKGNYELYHDLSQAAWLMIYETDTSSLTFDELEEKIPQAMDQFLDRRRMGRERVRYYSPERFDEIVPRE